MIISKPNKKLRCKDCGRVLKTKKERKLTVDPYLDEIKNKQVKGRWCNYCMRSMCADI